MIIALGTTPTVQRTMTFAKLSVDGVNRAIDVRETASGKSLNVARVLHTLGEDVVATGFLGGETGAFIRNDLHQSGIAHDFIEVKPRTRTCTSVIDQSAGTATELIQESSEVEADAWDRLRAKVEELLSRARVIVMSGTLPPKGPAGFYAWCVSRANEAGVKSIVDAAGEPLKLALAAKPSVVKVNRDELSKIFGDADLLSAAIRAGAGFVIMTMGGEGAVMSDGKEVCRLHVPRVNVVSPIGSGDSFSAGVAAGLGRGLMTPQAAKLGAACGVANTQSAVPGELQKAHVESFLQQIELQCE